MKLPLVHYCPPGIRVILICRSPQPGPDGAYEYREVEGGSLHECLDRLDRLVAELPGWVDVECRYRGEGAIVPPPQPKRSWPRAPDRRRHSEREREESEP